MSLDLMYCGLLVKLRHLGQSLRRDEPDLSTIRVGDTGKNEIAFDVAGVQTAHSLLIERHPFLWCPLGLIADSPQVAGERTINHHLQLGSNVFPLRQATGRGHLQILCCGRIISGLRGLKKSIQRAAGSGPAERISRGSVCRGIPVGSRLSRQQLISQSRRTHR